MNAISTKTARQVRLEKLEREIKAEAFEAFYHIGQKLLQIRRDRLYEDEGYRSWSAYCASGRIDYGRKHSDDYIRSSEMRPKLEKAGGIPPGGWTQHQVLELCKCETDRDAIRVAKKAIALAKKSKQRVTAKLIAYVRDGADETGVARKRLDAELEGASLEKHLGKLADILVDWRTSLEQVPLEQWEDVATEVLTRVRNEANALSTFLRS